MSPLLPLREAQDPARHGGKAVQLGASLRAGLPVPDGYALDHETVDRLAQGSRDVREAFLRAVLAIEGPVAVRSSAVGEDSLEASFAGQHATCLNVKGANAMLEAIAAVHASGRSEGALAYRRRTGQGDEPRVAVVIQHLVQADVAGVLFTRNPVSGADEIVIEAGWGLGECIVQGLVVPDRFRMTRCGKVLERVAGTKAIAVRARDDGGTLHEPLPPHEARRLCLGYADLRALHGLTARCDAAFGEDPHDVEWAIAAGQLYLLQRRPVTRTGGQA